MSETVKASVLHGPKDLRLEDRPISAPESNEVQVAIQSTGLCGSDLHYFNHFRNGDIIVREPLTLGHESAGTVVAVGRDVSSLFPGDRVALEAGLPCGDCECCRGRRYNICKGMRFRSSAKASPHMQGTLQERINHPAAWCHRLPKKLSLDQGALLEPLSVAMHASDRANLPTGATILVLGAGAVGLLCAAMAKATGAKTVVVVDIQGDRVDFALGNGFADAGFSIPMTRAKTTDEKLEYAKDVAGSIKSHRFQGTSIGEVDAVYECTGAETCLQTAIYATKPGGKIMLIGMGTPIMTLPISAAALREIDLIGVFRYANTYPRAIDLLSNPPADMPDIVKLVTQRYKGMDKITEAFEIAGQMKDSNKNLIIKVVVDMS